MSKRETLIQRNGGLALPVETASSHGGLFIVTWTKEQLHAFQDTFDRDRAPAQRERS